jgi:hypothetical protein
VGSVRDRCRGGVTIRDWRQGGLLFEIGVEGLLCEIGEGGGEWCCVKKRERTRKGGGVRGCNILEKGLRIFFFDYVIRGSLHLILMQHIKMGIQVFQGQRT